MGPQRLIVLSGKVSVVLKLECNGYFSSHPLRIRLNIIFHRSSLFYFQIEVIKPIFNFHLKIICFIKCYGFRPARRKDYSITCLEVLLVPLKVQHAHSVFLANS